jgi:hypothetical protein
MLHLNFAEAVQEELMGMQSIVIRIALVIPSTARNLQFHCNFTTFASHEMTISEI